MGWERDLAEERRGTRKKNTERDFLRREEGKAAAADAAAPGIDSSSDIRGC
jgi:hypothetical protein